MINLNWDLRTIRKCSLPSLHFAPFSHSRLACFLIASPCFAIATAPAPKLPAVAQFSEATPVFHVPLSEAAVTAETPAQSLRSSVERPRSQQRSRCALYFPSQNRYRRNGLVKAGESSAQSRDSLQGRAEQMTFQELALVPKACVLLLRECHWLPK